MQNDIDNNINKLQVRIVDWNRERGLLDKGFDPQLELKMLSEEAREFYMAETLEHMMCEYCDFLFVKAGTKAKYFSSLIESPSAFLLSRKNWNQMEDWIEDVESNMFNLLFCKFKAQGKAGLDKALNFTLSVIINNNNLKGTDKVDGKVVKSAFQENPVKRVEAYLERN